MEQISILRMKNSTCILDNKTIYLFIHGLEIVCLWAPFAIARSFSALLGIQYFPVSKKVWCR